MCQCCTARTLGKQSRLNGLGLEDNPYAPFDPSSVHWIRGWVTEDNEIRDAALSLVSMSARKGRII